MENKNVELSLGELYVVEEEFVQAETLKELKKKINKKINEGYRPIEANPFMDTTVVPNLWTAVLFYEETEEELQNEDN